MICNTNFAKNDPLLTFYLYFSLMEQVLGVSQRVWYAGILLIRPVQPPFECMSLNIQLSPTPLYSTNAAYPGNHFLSEVYSF